MKKLTSKLERGLLCGWTLLAASCVEELPPAEIPVAQELMPQPRERRDSPSAPIGAPGRPTQIEAVSFSYRDLPMLTRVTSPATIPFELRQDRLVIEGEPTFTRMDFAGVLLVGGWGETPSASAPSCGEPVLGSRAITVESVYLDRWTPTELRYAASTATFDRKACVGDIQVQSAVTARAIIPNLLYGFRRCTEGCYPNMSPDAEELVLIGPPSKWISASVSVKEQTKPATGAFTTARIPIRRGSSGSALMHVDWHSLSFFVRDRAQVGPGGWRDPKVFGERLELTAELTWPDGTEAPEGMAYVSAVTPTANQLRSAAHPK